MKNGVVGIVFFRTFLSLPLALLGLLAFGTVAGGNRAIASEPTGEQAAASTAELNGVMDRLAIADGAESSPSALPLVSSGIGSPEESVDLLSSLPERQVGRQLDEFVPQPLSLENAGMSRLTGLDDLSQTAVGQPNPAMAQVTSVSQLSDVQPTDWAFQSLQSLVERYGCIAGYPNGTYRGSRALTRYEFAAGLNACLDRVNELIAAGLADKVSREDLAVLQRLQEEFAAELATLRGRVDAAEARTAELEANQFSTTTKLRGVTVFHMTDSFFDDEVERETGTRDALGNPVTTSSDESSQVNFSYLTWLNLNSSFSGRDNLNIQLDVSNGQSPTNDVASAGLFNTWGTPFTQQSSGGNVRLRELHYSFPVGSAEFIVGLLDDGVSGGGIGSGAANTYLANMSWKITPNFGLFARYSYADYALWDDDDGDRIGDVVAQSVQAGLAFPDLGKEGAMAAVSYLIPYSYIDGREFVLSGAGDGGVQWEIEAAYFYPLTDNIAISPRLYVINNPNNFSDNPTVFVGNLRTQFRF